MDLENVLGVGEYRRFERFACRHPADEFGAHGAIANNHVVGKPTTDQLAHGGGRMSLDSGMMGEPPTAASRSGNPPSRVRVTVAPT